MHKSKSSRLIITLGLILSCIVVNAQNDESVIDSLLQQLQKEDLSSIHQIQTRIHLCKEYAESNPETGLEYIGQSFSLLKKYPNDSLFVHALLAKSTAYSYLAQYDSSTRLSLQALEIAEQHSDTIALLDANNNLGIDFMYTEDYEGSYKYLKELIRVAQLAKDSLRLGHGLNNLGLVEYYLGNEQRELECYLEAQVIFEKIGEKEGLANTILNIGTIYTVFEGDYELAQVYYKRALDIFDQLGYQSAYAQVLQSMSENYLEQKRYQKAEQTALEALDISEKNEFKQEVAYTYELIQKIYARQNNYQKAHEYLALYHKENDEIFNEEKSKQIKELQTKYETTKKEAEITRLSLQNDLQRANLKSSRNANIATGVGGGLTIILIIVFFTLRHKKQLIEKEAQDLQIEALKKRFMEIHSSPSELAVALDFVELNGKLNTKLTEREFETLKLSLEGKKNAEIAHSLFISVSTVKFHLRNTYSKMGVDNRKEAFQAILETA